MTSNFEQTVLDMLTEIFPTSKIIPQYYVKYVGQQLFFDAYIPSFSMVVECQGEQHYKFVPHFHGNRVQFKEHVWRDSLKKEWAQTNNITLIEVSYKNPPANSTELLSLICGVNNDRDE